MTTTALRRIAFGVVPAVLAVGVVSGCNDSAPSVQAPPATAASTASSTTDSVPTVTPTDTGGSSESTSPAVPTVSTAPSKATGDPAKVCTTDSDSFSTPAVLAPSTKKATWGKPLDLKQEYAGTVSMSAAKPVAKKPAANDYFGPPDGQVYLLIKVTVKYKSGDDNFLGDTFFTLRDSHNNVCDSDLLSSVVQQRQRFDSVTMSKTQKSYVGTLVYDVPANQDYSKYTLMYLPDSIDSKSANAPVAWTK